VYRYFFRLGVLDGRPGLVFHGLQGYWYRFLVGAKVLELRKAIGTASDEATIELRLSEASGLNIAGANSPIKRLSPVDSHSDGRFR